MAPLDRFDLIVTTPQCCLPELPNILHNVGPLNRLAEKRLAMAGEQWAPRLKDLPRPFVVLLVGGNSSTYELDPGSAGRLGREASALARAQGGSLLVSTSPRTPADAADALCQAIDVPSYVYRWRRDDPDNPYAAFLALADSLIVTVDSASQLVEACATGKPVHLFEWPMRPSTSSGRKGFLRRWRAQARQRPSTFGARLYGLLLYLGLIKPPRDFSAFHQALTRRGLLARLGAEASPVPRQPLDDLERAVARVRALFAA
jgi:mitochondrial fission protein ELM1